MRDYREGKWVGKGRKFGGTSGSEMGGAMGGKTGGTMKVTSPPLPPSEPRGENPTAKASDFLLLVPCSEGP